MKLKILTVSLLAFSLFTPMSHIIASENSSLTESTTSQIYDIIEMIGEKGGNGKMKLKVRTKAKISVDTETNRVFVTYKDTKYEAHSLGDNMWGFQAQDGYYFKFYYCIY